MFSFVLVYFISLLILSDRATEMSECDPAYKSATGTNFSREGRL